MMNKLPMGSLILVGFVVLIASLVWRVLNFVWLKPKRLEKYLRQQGFRGNSYRILTGDMSESSKMDEDAHSKPLLLGADILPRLIPFIHHTVQKYGKKCFTWLGPYPNVIITDPEIVRDIFTRHQLWPKPLAQAQVLVSGLVILEGQEWSKHRRLLNPSFRMDSLKDLFPGLYSNCIEMLEEWEGLASANGSVELDAWTYCLDLSRNMLARALFGDCYKDGTEIFKFQEEHIDLGLQATRSITTNIPGYRFVPTKFNRRLKAVHRKVETLLKAMIETKEKEINRGDDINNPDILSSILSSNYKLIEQEGPASGMTLDDIIGHCEQFYEAGQSATSSLFVWTLVMLSQHQDWQEKARDEILQVFGKNEPYFDGLSRLKIVTMVIHEVLRLYSPAYFTGRKTKQERKLEQFSLPEGVMVTIPMVLVQQDPDLWGNDAKEFKPQRFADGVAAATNGRLSFLPFGSGPRSCIGQNLSMVKAKLLLAALLQRFRLEISPAYTHAPFPVITTLPQHGARIIIHKL